MIQVNELVEFLLANPLFLVPLLFAVAMIVFAILKKLLKLAAIAAIATATLATAFAALRARTSR